MDCLKATLNLDMNHVGLGALDEFSLLVLFGNQHSRFLTESLPHNPSQIVDSKNNILYPAYFMTHLRIPSSLALSSFSLWDNLYTETRVKRYGDTILDSHYSARKKEHEGSPSITMQANSLFILDPSVFRTQHKQVSAPQAGAVREMERLNAPPKAIQESAKIRATGFGDTKKLNLIGDPYYYTLEFGRDTAPGHPLIFAKMPQLMEFSERALLRCFTQNKISEELLQAVSLLERKTFYYGNAFAGSCISMHTRGTLETCDESLWKENPKFQYIYRLFFETELYDNGELLAVSQSEKVIVHEIRNQAMIQDTKRLLKSISNEAGRNL